MDSDSRSLACLESRIPRLARLDSSLLSDPRTIQNLLKLDDQHLPTQCYFDYQTDLRPYMRRTVANWMVEVCDEQECHEDVLVTAVNYLDRVLTQLVPVKRSQLQLLAAACMFVASKFKDSTPITAQHLVMYTDWSVTLSELLDCELTVLQALKWELSVAGPYDFLDQLLYRIPDLSESNRTSLRRHSSILILMCTVEPKFLVCPPSLVCAASLCAAAIGLMGVQWCKASRVHRVVRLLTNIDKDTLLHHQHQIDELLAANVTTSRIPDDTNQSSREENSPDGTPTKSQNPPQRQPCTPTDVLDIQLTS